MNSMPSLKTPDSPTNPSVKCKPETCYFLFTPKANNQNKFAHTNFPFKDLFGNVENPSSLWFVCCFIVDPCSSVQLVVAIQANYNAVGKELCVRSFVLQVLIANFNGFSRNVHVK